MDSFRESARDVPVIGRPDVLVVGGGAAGIAAAVAAARRGASVWMLEQSSALGGLATVGLINLLLTLDDGNGTQVVAGICQEFVDRLDASGEARYPPREQWNREDAETVDGWRRWGLIWGAPESVRYSVAFDPDAFIDVAIEQLLAAGVRIRFHTWFADVAVDGDTITAVFVESKNGREAIVPSVVIDATGDADVVARAGAPSEQQSIPPHLWFRVGGVADDAPPGFWFTTTAPGRALVPWGPSSNRVDACDADDLSRALLECRAGARAAFADLRAQPGFEHAWLDDYAHLLGITESRRLVGDHVLAKEEADVRFPDAIARTGHWTRRDVVFDIPFRSLTAPGHRNLLAVGRCISTTRYVHQATKEIPAAMATGEAAGAAAFAAADAGIDVHAVDIEALRNDLLQSGVIC